MRLASSPYHRDELPNSRIGNAATLSPNSANSDSTPKRLETKFVALDPDSLRTFLSDSIKSLETTEKTLKLLIETGGSSSASQLQLQVCRLKGHLLRAELERLNFDELAKILVKIAGRVKYERKLFVADRNEIKNPE